MPATKIAMSVIACAVVLLAGCEMADQYATFVPKILRQPSTEPPAPEPEPDVKELVRAGADTLFTAHPTAVVQGATYWIGYGRTAWRGEDLVPA